VSVRLHVACAEVAPGTVVDGSIDGRFVVVWRTLDGVLVAGEGRCPHQWSPLDREGLVDGEELVCVAHGWRFATDGTGTKVNVKGRRDPKADLTSYPCREVEGQIWVDL